MQKNINEVRKRFRSRTQRDGDCVMWVGPVDKDGYGNCNHSYPSQRAHRTSFTLWKGPIPKGMWVLHTCDNKGCINPHHLYLGDVKQNVKDSVERGKHPRGPNPKKALKGDSNGNSKISSCDVISMRNEYIPWKNGAHKLSKKYGISKRQVLRILRREVWDHI